MSQKQPQESRLPRPPTYPPMPPIATHRRDAEQATRIEELERQVKHLEAELAATRKQLVYEFNGDDVPSFRDGVLIPHELEDVVDAERCWGLANIITGLRKQLAEAQAFDQQAAGGLMAWSCCVPDYFPGKHNPQDCIGKYKCTATSALQSAIETAVEPYKRDAERLDMIAIYGSFGTDSITGELGGNGQKRVAATRQNIDAALAAKEGK